MDEKEIEEAWTIVLGSVFKEVDWNKIRGRNRKTDVFEHRLTYATHQENVASLIQKLLNGLSLQAPPLPTGRIESLREDEMLSMKIVRRYSKLLTLKAAEYAGYL